MLWRWSLFLLQQHCICVLHGCTYIAITIWEVLLSWCHQLNQQTPIILANRTHKKAMTYDVGNSGRGLGQTTMCVGGGLNRLMGSQPSPLDNLISNSNTYTYKREATCTYSLPLKMNFVSCFVLSFYLLMARTFPPKFSEYGTHVFIENLISYRIS
jgi:hypothetical protein